MSIFNKLNIPGRLRNILAAPPAAAAVAADADNAFDNSRRIINAALHHLRPLAGAGGDTELHFWLEGNAAQQMQLLLEGDQFRNDFCQELFEQRLEQFTRRPFTVHDQTAPEGVRHLYTINESLKMTIGPLPKVPVRPQTVMHRAWLRLVDGTGYALQPDMQLIPDEKKRRWCIGRGRNHMDSTSVRRNDYVVNDGAPEAPGGSVSRAHCDIHYRNGAFYLQACPGGCRAEGGAATKLVPADSDSIVELHSSTLQRQLRPGDIIALGNGVQLLFDR